MFFQIVKRVNIADTKILILHRLMGLLCVKPVLPVVHASRIYCTVVNSQNQRGFTVLATLPYNAVCVQHAPRAVNSRITDNAFVALAGKLYRVRN